jgi:hypothetical protein
MVAIRMYETALSCNPKEFKDLLFKFGKVVVVVDKLENDY